MVDGSEYANRVIKALFQSAEWEVDYPAIDIFDASGPLLFQDYIFESQDKAGWVRLFPHNSNALVSIETGIHPYNSLKGSQEELHVFSERDARAVQRVQSIAKLGSVPHYDNRIYCYHYPNLGTLKRLVNQDSVFIDLYDGAEFPVSEMGENSTETRSCYSFIQSLTEAGAPGPISVPKLEHTILPKALIAQERNNWCAAAALAMIADFYGIEVSQGEIARRMNISEADLSRGAEINDQVAAYNSILGPEIVSRLDTAALAQSCIDHLMNGLPVKIGIFRHAQACFGWKTIEGEILYEIHDPMPVGIGKVKWQNPSVIWTQNHILTQPQEKIMGDNPSPLKQALAALVGMPAEEVLAKYGEQLHAAEADMIRKLTAEDIENIRKTDSLIAKALAESGGGNGCGVYY